MNPNSRISSVRKTSPRTSFARNRADDVPDSTASTSRLFFDKAHGDVSEMTSPDSNDVASRTRRRNRTVCSTSSHQASLTVFGLSSAFQMAVALMVIGAVSMSIPTAFSEVVFHRRDHTDQGNYGPSQPSYNVRSYSDALVSDSGSQYDRHDSPGCPPLRGDRPQGRDRSSLDCS